MEPNSDSNPPHPIYLLAIKGHALTQNHIQTLIQEHLGRVYTHPFLITSTENTIHVRWIDGPTIREIENILHHYRLTDHDPVNGENISRFFYLTPSGECHLAYSPSTLENNGSFNEILHDPPSPCSLMIENKPGVCFIHATRKFSSSLLLKAISTLKAQYDQNPNAFDPTPIDWSSITISTNPDGTATLQVIPDSQYQDFPLSHHILRITHTLSTCINPS